MRGNFFPILLLFIPFLKSDFSVAQANHTKPNLHLDHFVFFVSDTSLESKLKANLNEAKLLATRHNGQGTSGKYFLFYNTYIELLYLEDSLEVIENEKRFGSPYIERWSASPLSHLGFGLNLIPFDTSKTSFEFHRYSIIDSPPGEYYIMPKYNEDNGQPFTYISLPHRQYQQFESLDEIDEKVEEFKRKDLKHYLSHPSGIKKLTQVTLTHHASTCSGNLELLKNTKGITLKEGQEDWLILEFDNGIQGKEIRFQGDVNLLINY